MFTGIHIFIRKFISVCIFAAQARELHASAASSLHTGPACFRPNPTPETPRRFSLTTNHLFPRQNKRTSDVVERAHVAAGRRATFATQGVQAWLAPPACEQAGREGTTMVAERWTTFLTLISGCLEVGCKEPLFPCDRFASGCP